ncbi:DUF3105 domain-containing protein [Lolliginicoccus suaedae]|uniref:DUF3105 domain-containing protein n=1 Tax=Lolliginicoccus suaedae TaxID=2605429 RepID=UPI0011EBD94A|nr:DUF3105 domain-containing protein [Lolliginicoccus suaedae]
MASSKNDRTARAMRAAKKKSRGGSATGLKAGPSIPWLSIGAIVSVVVLIGVIAWSLAPSIRDEQAMERWTPSVEDPDPSTRIDGVEIVEDLSNAHVLAGQRVAYEPMPPFGGPHDEAWATCTGIVYDEPIRTENAVHSLEHGAVWITYSPDNASAADIAALESRVDGQAYMFMSPFPGQESPISLQAWGHQLKLDSAEDERINQFIGALRLNQFNSPEPGASCSNVPGYFDPENPPPFDPAPPGPDAVAMDGAGAAPEAAEMGAPLDPGPVGEAPAGDDPAAGIPAEPAPADEETTE